MPEVIFSHEAVNLNHGGPLHVATGADEITWGYGLNTQVIPTYGGEVVQILSAYTDDLVVTGTVRSYRQMERIYSWFLSYLQIATQTGDGAAVAPFNQTPVTMSYPYRGWTLGIVPKSLPGLRYGRDVVAPTWRMEAAVVEQDRDLTKNIVTAAHLTAASERGINLADFSSGRVTAEIGVVAEKFSDPFPGEHPDERTARTKIAVEEIGDYFGSIVSAYAQHDFSNLLTDYGSHPVALIGGVGGKGDNEIVNGTVEGSKRG